MAATIGMIVPDLFGRFEGYLSPSMSLAGRSTIEGTLSCFVSRTSSIINHQSSIINHQSSIINHQSSIIITQEKNGWFCSQKKQLLTEPRSLKFSDVPCTIEARILFFLQMTSEKCIKSADCISGSNQFDQFCLFVSIHFIQV